MYVVTRNDGGRPVIVDCNQAFLQTLGYTREETIGRSFADFYTPASRSELLDRGGYQRALEGRFTPAERQLVTRDGRVVETLVHVLPEKHEDGRVWGTRAMFVDITARKRMEEELRFHALLLDQATAAVVATDPSGIVTHWNAYAEKLYGWARQHAVGRHLRELGLEATDPAVQQEIEERLRAREGWEGELSFKRRCGAIMPIHLAITPVVDGGTFRGFVGVAVDLSERKSLEAKLTRLALRDPLTDLPNRVLFMDRLEHALSRAARDRTTTALLFCDLDRFKLVNDSLGHHAGDTLLIEIGRRLQAAARGDDTIARLGGDEFTILLEGLHGVSEARQIAERLLRAINRPVIIDRQEIIPSASIGIAISPRGAIRAGDLLRNADMAMYRAKAQGRGTYAIFDQELHHAALMRIQLEADLRSALDRNELRLLYQPIVDLESGTLVALEALVRWEHPTRGLLAPGQFMAMAEDTGLIIPLGRWVLAQACRDLQAWQSAGLLVPPHLNVNVSGRQFADPGFLDSIAQVLSETGLEPDRLQLEVSERVLAEELISVGLTLRALRTLGVRIAMDDFGAGSSSLAHLQAMNPQMLKLDRSFITDLGTSEVNRTVVAGVVDLAHQLGVVVTAEGIETTDQACWARSAGCDCGQGYYFERPVPASTIVGLLPAAGASPIGTRLPVRGSHHLGALTPQGATRRRQN
jgi:diguanylate cyclase (GGDEF)-like protein/PAS domain S-box-containing protein